MNSKIKVLHILSGDLWAGAEILTYSLIKNLKNQKNIAIRVVLFNNKTLYKKLKEEGIKIYLIDETKYNSPVSVLIKLLNIIRKTSPSIVHTHKYKETILSAFVFWGKTNIKLLQTVHGDIEPYKGIQNIKIKLYELINYTILKYKFSLIIAVSKDLKKKIIEKRKIKKNNIITIYNGIQIPEKIKTNINNKNKIIIGSAGRFVLVKNYLFLIDIAKEVREKYKKIEFWLIGDGPEKQKILEKIFSDNLQTNFKILPFSESISYFYKNIDIYINTSKHEGLPLSILEALSYSVPVIAPKIGGLPEIIMNGIDGFLIEPSDLEEYVQKCLLLSRNQSLRIKMGKAGKEKVKKFFSIQRMAENYYQIYKELIKPY